MLNEPLTGSNRDAQAVESEKALVRALGVAARKLVAVAAGLVGLVDGELLSVNTVGAAD